MTVMMPNENIFILPRRSDSSAIEAHKDAVFTLLGDLFSEIDSALRAALPKAKKTFALHEGPVDLAVHAPWTRYLVRLALTSKSKEVLIEDEVDFDLLRVSNCGLCIRTDFGDIRILKSTNDGLPKASSDARVSFVMNNQLSFAFIEEATKEVRKLNLFVLWRMDSNYEYLGIDIVCPQSASDKGNIECYWKYPWLITDGARVKKTTVAAPDLDEIVAIPARDKKISK